MEITCDICPTVHMVTRPRLSHFCTVKLMVHIRLKICRISLKLFLRHGHKRFSCGIRASMNLLIKTPQNTVTGACAHKGPSTPGVQESCSL